MIESADRIRAGARFFPERVVEPDDCRAEQFGLVGEVSAEPTAADAGQLGDGGCANPFGSQTLFGGVEEAISNRSDCRIDLRFRQCADAHAP